MRQARGNYSRFLALVASKTPADAAASLTGRAGSQGQFSMGQARADKLRR